jgi:tetratricopeptide (TPR) repeat protein
MAKAPTFEQALALGYGGEQARAIEQLDTLLCEEPEDENRGWIVLYKAMFLAQIDRIAEARGLLDDLQTIWKDTPDHRARIAVADALFDEAQGDAFQTLRKLGLIFESFRELWTLEETRDLYEEVQFNRGRLEATIGDWRSALPVLQECLNFERVKAAEFYYHLGFCYFEAGNLEKAEQYLDLALSRNLLPSFAAAAHFYLGRLFNRKGAFARALNQFEQALSQAESVEMPRKAIYTELTKSCELLGLADQAKEYGEQAKKIIE